MSTRKLSLGSSLAAAVFLFASPSSAEVVIDWVDVVFASACDPQLQGCFGGVTNGYRISKFETTNAQYSEFLNAVAATDANALYNPSMGSGVGGITRSGSSGSFSYSAIAGREDMPVNFVSFWDATRFANWLHNAQPTGAQDNTTTEDGAYTLTPTDIMNNTVMRNSGAAVFVPSEDEWYKTAYYNKASNSFFDYPAGSDTQTTCAVPGATANTANCGNAVVDVTDVGSYTGAASPSGTFDQGGNVFEWNEAIIVGTLRGQRGGDYIFSAASTAAEIRSNDFPTFEFGTVGFRVASPIFLMLPSLSPLGIAMAWSLLGLAGWRKLRR